MELCTVTLLPGGTTGGPATNVTATPMMLETIDWIPSGSDPSRSLIPAAAGVAALAVVVAVVPSTADSASGAVASAVGPGCGTTDLAARDAARCTRGVAGVDCGSTASVAGAASATSDSAVAASGLSAAGGVLASALVASSVVVASGFAVVRSRLAGLLTLTELSGLSALSVSADAAARLVERRGPAPSLLSEEPALRAVRPRVGVRYVRSGDHCCRNTCGNGTRTRTHQN